MELRRCLALSFFSLMLATAVVVANPPDLKTIPNSVVELPMTGTVKSVNAAQNSVEVQDDFGKTITANVAQNVQILKDGKTIPLSSVKTGDHVTVMNRTE